jgi:hypothetical protein
MTPLQADLEALMPEPTAKVLSWTCGSYSRHYKLDWLKDVPEGATLFTADQMREAILAATERAAKKVEEVGPNEGPLALVTAGFAAAIRGDAGGGQ